MEYLFSCCLNESYSWTDTQVIQCPLEFLVIVFLGKKGIHDESFLLGELAVELKLFTAKMRVVMKNPIAGEKSIINAAVKNAIAVATGRKAVN